MIKFLLGGACGLVVALGLTTVLDGISLRLGERSVVPDSCRQPADIDYSDVGRADRSPYAVEISSFRGLLRGTASDAMIGHSPDAETEVSSGEVVDLQSSDIDAFSCRWSDAGVTIIEPALEPADPDGITIEGIEHFVPASNFLGGR